MKLAGGTKGSALWLRGLLSLLQYTCQSTFLIYLLDPTQNQPLVQISHLNLAIT